MKTLHFVVRVTVPDGYSIARVKRSLTNRLEYGSYWGKPIIRRPRGKLGVLLRALDKKSL